MKEYKITDTEISNRIEIALSTINVWKKTKVKLYEQIRNGFLLEMELEDLKVNAKKYEAIEKIVSQ